MRDVPTWLMIAMMGSFGALLRFAITQGSRQEPQGVPWGTLSANLLGCFLLGALVAIARQEPPVMGPLWRNALSVGFLGALTTFSTFSFETWDRWQRGLVGVAMANVVLNVSLGLVCVWLGQWMARNVMST